MNYWRIEIPCKVYSADSSRNLSGKWETGDKLRITVSALNASEAVEKVQDAIRIAVLDLE